MKSALLFSLLYYFSISTGVGDEGFWIDDSLVVEESVCFPLLSIVYGELFLNASYYFSTTIYIPPGPNIVSDSHGGCLKTIKVCDNQQSLYTAIWLNHV